MRGRAVAQYRDAKGAREAEVGELELAVLVNEQVLRLQVAVQHPPVMAEGHPAQQLPRGEGGEGGSRVACGGVEENPGDE